MQPASALGALPRPLSMEKATKEPRSYNLGAVCHSPWGNRALRRGLVGPWHTSLGMVRLPWTCHFPCLPSASQVWDEAGLGDARAVEEAMVRAEAGGARGVGTCAGVGPRTLCLSWVLIWGQG